MNNMARKELAKKVTPVADNKASNEKKYTQVQKNAEADNAITQEKIDSWKREHGKIYRSVIGKNVIIWRRIKRSEYIDVMTNEGLSEDPEVRIYQRQEGVLKTVCLYPENIEDLIDNEGCLATNLGGEILDRSGFAMPVTSEI